MINHFCGLAKIKYRALVNANYSNALLSWLLIFSAFSINLPIAFGSVSLVLFFVFCLIFFKDGIKLPLITQNPGALVACAFLCFYAVGMIYSSAPCQDSFHYFKKYLKFLVIPLSVSVLVSDRYRAYAINAFIISLIGYVLISYLNWLGFFSFGVMRHGTYMALGAYLMLRNARRKAGHFRVVWIVLSVLTIFNILFIADVRTGIVTLFILLLVFSIETWKFRGVFYFIGFLLVTLVMYKNISDTSNLRVVGINKEVKTNKSSAGQRLEMYGNTILLIKKHLFFGGGTGSIESEYAELIKDNSSVYIRRVTNPHNQYLLTTQELGVMGLLMLISFFVVHWWQSYKLPSKENACLLRALVISTSVGSLFNSLLLDSGDGRMYCILAGVLLSSFIPKPIYR